MKNSIFSLVETAECGLGDFIRKIISSGQAIAGKKGVPSIEEKAKSADLLPELLGGSDLSAEQAPSEAEPKALAAPSEPVAVAATAATPEISDAPAEVEITPSEPLESPDLSVPQVATAISPEASQEPGAAASEIIVPEAPVPVAGKNGVPGIEEKAKLAYLLFEHIESQIRFADTKAQLTLAADAIVAGAIGSSLTGTIVPSAKAVMRYLLDHNAPFLDTDRLLALFTILMFFALATSFGCSLLAVMPRNFDKLRKKIKERMKPEYLSPTTHAQISDLKPSEDKWETFIDRFDRQTAEGLNKSILSEVYLKSTNAQLKYTWVRWSIRCLFAVLILWVIVQSLLAFS